MTKIKNEVFLKYLMGEATIEQTMQALSALGISPSIVHTESNMWGVYKLGVQNIEQKTSEIEIAFYLYGSQRVLRPTVREAMLEFLWPKSIYETDSVLVKPDRTVLIKKYPL